MGQGPYVAIVHGISHARFGWAGLNAARDHKGKKIEGGSYVLCDLYKGLKKHPHLIGGDTWVGAMVANSDSCLAHRWKCADMTEVGASALNDAEHLFEKDAAQEAWMCFRAHCVNLCGFDPGEGYLLLVSGSH